MTNEERRELDQYVESDFGCEGWNYLTSYSNIESESGVRKAKGVFIYSPEHGNPQLVKASTYGIMCDSRLIIPAGRVAIVTLTSYVIGRAKSRWSVKILSEDYLNKSSR